MRKSQNPDGRADKSKLGRLPFAIRNAVARMLRDGATAKQVCEFVNASPDFAALRRETGCGPLNAQNVTDWRSGGYIAWCREQQRADRLRALAESAYHIADATGGSPAGVGASILAGRLVDMLENADDSSALELAGALVNLRRGENEAARLELDRRREELRRESLQLEREKFRWQAASTALKLFEDARARAVAEGPGTNEEKIRALIAYMDAQEGGSEG